MIKKSKRTSESAENPEVSPKKFKSDLKKEKSRKTDTLKQPKSKKDATPNKTKQFASKPPFNKTQQHSNSEKTNWTEYKQQKKELKVKRKQSNVLYDVIVEAKKIAELLRQKKLKSDKEERNKLVGKLHGLLSGKEHYAKLVLSHDMARVVQYLLKFGTQSIREEVSKEILPLTVEMLLSKYGRYCLKNLLKYGNGKTRFEAIKKMYGHAVKLTSHSISAAVFEYCYATWASPQQKQHLIQEFFGDIYKQAKDDGVKHLNDVYKDNSTMKAAALNATKANLSRILNKSLLDSTLVQSVLYQFLTECSAEDKTQFIAQLSPHVTVLSNSKNGARVAMNCIWYGSNKDRKVAMKSIKEHIVDLSKHEHGHCTVIALLDAADDTVLVNKMIITQILENVEVLAADEWGRKVLLWLVRPYDPMHFHPIFIKELETGRQIATSKKAPEVRSKELLQYSAPTLLNAIVADPKFWLSNASIAVVTLATLKSGSCEIKPALQAVADTITDLEWKINENNVEVSGIEHAGLHMIIKKLAQHDKLMEQDATMTFGKILLDTITDKTIKMWIKLNRGCYILVNVYENGNDNVQKQMKDKFSSHMKTLAKQTSGGAKILLSKFE